MAQYSNSIIKRLSGEPPWIVGVINTTPDSFSDGGKFLSADAALMHAQLLIEHGADIIEVGGESTGPGTKPVSTAEEIRRIEPVVKTLASKIIVSVDTYKAQTAERALKLGALLINDVSALRADPDIAQVISNHGASVVLMHCKEDRLPHVSATDKFYRDITSEIAHFFKERISFAVSCGITQEQLILDPGMGRFISNDPEDSWALLSRFDELASANFGCPWMIATSRKGFLGGALAERDAASQLTALIGVMKGASFIRTHNVKMAREFVDIWKRTSQRSIR